MNESQENNQEVRTGADLKQETVNTFNEAKEQMKNINFKQEAEVGKGLLKNMWKNPIETIKEIANDQENKTLKTSILLVGIWVVVELIEIILYYLKYEYASFELLDTIKTLIAPICAVIAMTLAVYIVNNRAKETIAKVLTSVAIAYIPQIIYSLLYLLRYISTRMYSILTPVSGFLRVISIILMYQTVKALSNEKDDANVLKTFIKVEAVYYVIVFVVSFLGISI